MSETTESTAETTTAPDAAVSTTPAAKSRGQRGGKNRRPAPQRQTSPVLERLFELYPNMFGARFLPLKLGIFQELMEKHPEDFKKEELKIALGQHTRSTRYLEAVAAGHKRHGLDGEPVSDLSPEHIHHALLEVYRRRQSRSKEDLRPWLRDQIARAIASSGLSREDYEAISHSNDETAIAALQEAFEEIAQTTAKQEALVRAYKASGRSVEEFAEMYGMDAQLVREAVAAS